MQNSHFFFICSEMCVFFKGLLLFPENVWIFLLSFQFLAFFSHVGPLEKEAAALRLTEICSKLFGLFACLVAIFSSRGRNLHRRSQSNRLLWTESDVCICAEELERSSKRLHKFHFILSACYTLTCSNLPPALFRRTNLHLTKRLTRLTLIINVLMFLCGKNFDKSLGGSKNNHFATPNKASLSALRLSISCYLSFLPPTKHMNAHGPKHRGFLIDCCVSVRAVISCVCVQSFGGLCHCSF